MKASMRRASLFNSRLDSGVEETIIYKIDPTQWDTDIPLLEITIRKVVMDKNDCDDEEFEHALQLIRQVTALC